MFDIGFLELSVILILSLLVLGPERLPKAAKSVGYWFGKMRRYVESMKSQVEAEFDTAEVKRLLHNQEVQIRELQTKLQSGGEDLLKDDAKNEFEAPHAEYEPENEEGFAEKKLEYPQYDIIEEDDEEWDKLAESNPVKDRQVQSVEGDSDKASDEAQVSVSKASVPKGQAQ